MAGSGVDIIDKLPIHDSCLKRHLRILMMREEQALEFIVFVFAVDLFSISDGRDERKGAHQVDRLRRRVEVSVNQKEDTDAIGLFAHPETGEESRFEPMVMAGSTHSWDSNLARCPLAKLTG